MEYFNRVLGFAYFVLEFAIGSLIFFSSRVRKPRFWVLAACFGVGLIGLSFLFGGLYFWIPGWENYDFVAYSVISVVVTAFLFLAHDERKKKIAFSFIAGICIRMGGSWLAELIFLFMPNLGTAWMGLIRLCIVLLTYVPIYWTLGKVFRDDLNFEPGKGELAFLIVATTALFPMAYFTRVVGESLPLQIYLLILLALIPYLLLSFEAISFRHFRGHYRTELERQNVAAQLSQYESMAKVISALNIKIHDLKHQLAAGAGETAYEGIRASINEYEDYVKTGYEKLDTILTEKKIISSQSGVAFMSVIDGKRFKFLKLEDLVSLFGNLLDNAFESAKSQEGGFIDARSSIEGHFLCLSVSNSCPKAPVFGKNGLPRTSKKDRSMHGFGTQSIARIAQAYGGSAFFRFEDGVFKAIVLFPMQEEPAR